MQTQKSSLHIRFISGPLHGKLLEVNQFPCAIGRELDNDIVLADDRVSRYHASIKLIHDAYYLYDNKSHNGTLHKGHSIEKLCLEQGMEFQIGFSVLKIETLI
ncbi:MAG TPA: FHA domain-containing protein [Oligoflexia bacterium]|nr:FHA domain-containing protein [Oligoflexia bacterium]HMR25643.1 FHA domain-containing protein [Oligoflexia bacterium]